MQFRTPPDHIFWKPVLLLLLLLGIPGIGAGQLAVDASPPASPFIGLPIIQNFNPKEYLHLTPHFEHTSIIQDGQGVMYVGSQGGVLLYNGSRWQFVTVPGKDLVWSLGYHAADGRVYVGASDNLGYIKTNASGQKEFVSLLPQLPKEIEALGFVWGTFVTESGVYFKTNHYLLRWHEGRFRVWKAADGFGGAYLINQKLFVHQPGKGMFVLQNDSLALFSDNRIFTAEIPQFLLPLAENKWLLTTYKGGLYWFENGQTRPVDSTIQSFLLGQGLFSGTRLPDGTLGLTTLKGGLILTDEALNIRRIINEAAGLPTNTIYLISTDKQGGVWLSSESGLSRLRLDTPFSYFNKQNGLQRQTYAVHQHQGQLYAGTTDGLYQLKERTPLGASATFEKAANFGSNIWSFLSYDQALLIASDEGLFEWQQDKVTLLPISDNPWNNYCRDLERSVLDSTLVYAASYGLYVFRREATGWKKAAKIPGLDEGLTQLLQTPAGDLWIPVHAGLVRLRFPKAEGAALPEDFFLHPVIGRYGPAQGLPAGTPRLYLVGGELIAQLGEINVQLFRYREDLNRFEPVPNFGAPFGLAGQLVHPAQEYQQGAQHWLWTKKKEAQRWKLNLATKGAGGAYTLSNFDFSGVTEPFKRFVYQQNSSGPLWYAGLEGLVRFDWAGARVKKYPFPTLLERVVLSDGSVVNPAGKTVPALSFAQNTVRFEFAAPSYNGAEENKFQYWLEGYEEGWSGWSGEYAKEYTRIPAGNYMLHARALNAQGEIGKPVTFAFTILPPWYRTGYMYVLYLLLGLGGVWLLIRWRSAQLRAEKAVLEGLVAARTTELAQKNKALNEQSQELAQQAEKLKELDGIKSRFFANISHEFRTPLSLILNNVLDTLSGAERTPKNSQVSVPIGTLQVMARNARRLLQLINQLLDLSKAESGNMQLVLQNGDLKQLLRLVYASFSSMADLQQIQFKLRLPEEPLWCQYDEDKLEKILYNLLSNAFKFTPAQGSILLEVSGPAVLPHQLSASIQIKVQDSGPGIPAAQLAHVFNRFYQGEQYYTDAQGTGIGLALTKELVELHQGQIAVESAAGNGTTFTVYLPFVPAAGTPAAGVPAAGDPAADAPAEEETVSAAEMLPAGDNAYPVPMQSALLSGDGEDAAVAGKEEQPLLLLVEDNEDLRHYIKRHLQGQYRVLEGFNGKQGLALAQEVVPDLIISDWMMPELDGLALCRLLKTDERTSHIPLILLTALATTDARLQGLETGADDYLTKPFNARELQIRIHNMLENRRRQREHFSRVIRLEPTQTVIASADEKFIRRIMQIVETRMTDSDFSVEDFSREAGLSRVHLHRKLKALTGQSPSDFIRLMRLKQAAQLLQARSGNVAEIAYEVGFNNLSYFSKCFREEFGLLPTEYAAGLPASLQK